MEALEKLERGERIMGAGAIVLLVSLFLPWFGTAEEDSPFIAPARKVTINAWQSFDVVDLLLCLLALGTLAALIATLRGIETGRELRTVLGLLAGSLVAAGIILGHIETQVQNTSTRFGLWIGLLAVLAIAAGAWITYEELDGG